MEDSRLQQADCFSRGASAMDSWQGIAISYGDGDGDEGETSPGAGRGGDGGARQREVSSFWESHEVEAAIIEPAPFLPLRASTYRHRSGRQYPPGRPNEGRDNELLGNGQLPQVPLPEDDDSHVSGGLGASAVPAGRMTRDGAATGAELEGVRVVGGAGGGSEFLQHQLATEGRLSAEETASASTAPNLNAGGRGDGVVEGGAAEGDGPESNCRAGGDNDDDENTISVVFCAPDGSLYVGLPPNYKPRQYPFGAENFHPSASRRLDIDNMDYGHMEAWAITSRNNEVPTHLIYMHQRKVFALGMLIVIDLAFVITSIVMIASNQGSNSPPPYIDFLSPPPPPPPMSTTSPMPVLTLDVSTAGHLGELSAHVLIDILGLLALLFSSATALTAFVVFETIATVASAISVLTPFLFVRIIIVMLAVSVRSGILAMESLRQQGSPSPRTRMNNAWTALRTALTPQWVGMPERRTAPASERV